MKKIKTYRLMLGLAVFMAASVQAEQSGDNPSLSDPALEAILHQGLESNEGVQLQSLVKADIDPTPGEESVVVWTLLGPSYWSTHLSVLAKQEGHWNIAATAQLSTGKARLVSVTPEGTITLSAKVAGPNDPVCCPSQTQTVIYQYIYNANIKLKEVKK